MLTLLYATLLLNAADPQAVIYGKPLATDNVGVAMEMFCGGYATKFGLHPTEAELAPLRKQFGPDVKGFDFPRAIILSFKLNRVWWKKHGGRLVLSAFGVHLATDAMLKEVEQAEQSGNVQFVDTAFRRKFFAYYQSYRGDGVVTGDRAREILDKIPGK